MAWPPGLAVICGFGRGVGETMRITVRNGEEFAVFSRYGYKMTKNKKG
jgi:hypothetical protein